MNTLDKTPVWAANAKDRMNQLNLKYADILHVFNVRTTDAIGHYFNGRREPGIDGLLSLASFLHMSNDQLFMDSEELESNGKLNDADHLLDTFKILLRLNKVNDEDCIVVLNTIDKLGTRNIIEASNALSNQFDKGLPKMDTVLEIQKYMTLVA